PTSSLVTQCYPTPRSPPSFPTRRSSDLGFQGRALRKDDVLPLVAEFRPGDLDALARDLDAMSIYLPSTLANNPRERLRVMWGPRSEEHTSELQSRENLVCRLLLEKNKDA